MVNLRVQLHVNVLMSGVKVTSFGQSQAVRQASERSQREQSIGAGTTICVVAAPPAICVRRLRLPLLGKRYWNIIRSPWSCSQFKTRPFVRPSEKHANYGQFSKSIEHSHSLRLPALAAISPSPPECEQTCTVKLLVILID